MNLRRTTNSSKRRELVEKETGVSLGMIGASILEENIASLHNCENMIGFTQVPVGIAGPLMVLGAQDKESGINKEVYVPLATTEGALIASVSRGCKAISEGGGARVRTQKVGTTRGPVFTTTDSSFGEWLQTHKKDLAAVAQKTSHHITLLSCQSQNVGQYWYIRFSFDTQDAMGMNMATIATEALVSYITQQTSAVCISLAGNYDTDKKVSWLNIIQGRGIQSWAEVELSEKTIQTVLKTSADTLYDVWLAKCLLGSIVSGSVGYNCHFANVLAALFLATGQDIAHVSECSVGITTVKKQTDNGLYVSVYLPDLLVGTIGGGTGLPTQHEALQLLGVAGGSDGKNALRFAEIVGATVLAGEISLLGSLAEGSLADAHKRLARGG